ncbi:MAG: sulfatase-like hydrolase/transferase [Planctomycetota bacterium]
MKVQNLLQGVLMGACMAGWASLIEAFSVYAAFPYHTDPLVWTGLLPKYMLIGAGFGLLCALVLPLVTKKKAREDDPNLRLGLLILIAGTTLVLLLEARMTWIPVAVPTLAKGSLLTFAMILGGGAAAFLVLGKIADTSLGWALSSFFSRFATVVGIVLLAVFGLVSLALPVRPALLAEPARAASAPSDSPNVLFIVLDTTSAKHLGAYGYHRATSPRLDALAEEGVLFENAFSAAPWTLPSHCSMFTGLHPTSHGTGWLQPRLPDGMATVDDVVRYDIHTISEEMALRGYDTVSVAEKSWLTFNSGLSQGFEKFFDFSIAGLADNFFLNRFWARYRDKFGSPVVPQIDKGGARVVDTAIDWLDGHRSRDESRPFFMFMNLNEAHDPYQPPADYWGHFLPEGIDIAETHALTPRNNTEGQHQIILGDWDITDREMEIFKSLYDDEILYQDMLLGRLFDSLEELELMEDTLIVITADHGEEFGELAHRVGHQLALTDRLLHVPLIMRYPKQLPAGKRMRTIASTIDIYPTILDVVETAQQLTDDERPFSPDLMSIEGVSQLPAILEDALVRDMIMAHYFNPTSYLAGFDQWDNTRPDGGLIPKVSRTMRSIDVIRTLDEKLYVFGDGQRAFINLQQDPVEQGSEDQSIPEGSEERARFFEERWQRQVTSYESARELLVGQLAWFRRNVKWHNVGVNVDAASSQNMEAMGYVGSGGGDATESEEPLTLPPILKK